jgi:hypothetical protein
MDMNERHIRKVQKQRHMGNIDLMVLSNPIFKNLADRDRKKLARLIYKAEMIEMHIRDKSLMRVNESFQDIIDAIGLALLDGEDELDRDKDDDDF